LQGFVQLRAFLEESRLSLFCRLNSGRWLGGRLRQGTTHCLIALLFGLFVPSASPSVQAQTQSPPPPGTCIIGPLPKGANSAICFAGDPWNGDLFVWLHGYLAPNQPLGWGGVVQPDGSFVPPFVGMLPGTAFATTMYRSNGLAILEQVEDTIELIEAFPAIAGRPPDRVILAGGSMSGLVAALIAERTPKVVDAVVTMCGPIGDFGAQMSYVIEFRALFDAYFPGVLPGTATEVPQELLDHWSDTYEHAILVAYALNPAAAFELSKVSGVPYDLTNPGPTLLLTHLPLLWFSTVVANDLRAHLGGNAYDNMNKVYTGSSNDTLLNASVKRYRASPTAIFELQRYRTTGRAGVPMMAMHTWVDPFTPIWHPIAYAVKANMAGSPNFMIQPAARWGHCEFTVAEGRTALMSVMDRIGGAHSMTAARSDESTTRLNWR
jgi:pimeloyl-ACP methyl ester carboxylesterase